MFIVCFLRMFSLFLVKFFEFLLNVESINLLCKTWYVTGDNFLVEGRFPWKSKGIFHVVYPWSIDNKLFFSKSWEEAAWSGNQISFRTILSYIHLMTYKNIQHTLTSSNFNLPIINWNCRWKFSQNAFVKKRNMWVKHKQKSIEREFQTCVLRVELPDVWIETMFLDDGLFYVVLELFSAFLTEKLIQNRL